MTKVRTTALLMPSLAACGGNDDPDDGATVTAASSATLATTTTQTSGPDPSDTSEPDDTTEDGAAAESGGENGVCESDDDEPNEVQDDAVALPETTDCNVNASVAGALSRDADVDWFYYRGSDTFGCVVDPSREVIASGEVRFCKFARCVTGATSIDACPAGTVNAATDEGDPGCCAEGLTTTNFAVTPGCAGAADDVRIYMRIDRGAAERWTTYSARYHF